MRKRAWRSDAGITLLEFLIALGVVALIALVFVMARGSGGSGTSGSSGSNIPGGQEFLSASGAFKTITTDYKPDAEICKILQTYYGQAQSALSTMQVNAALQPAIDAAQKRLDEMKKYLDDHCS